MAMGAGEEWALVEGGGGPLATLTVCPMGRGYAVGKKNTMIYFKL